MSTFFFACHSWVNGSGTVSFFIDFYLLQRHHSPRMWHFASKIYDCIREKKKDSRVESFCHFISCWMFSFNCWNNWINKIIFLAQKYFVPFALFGRFLYLSCHIKAFDVLLLFLDLVSLKCCHLLMEIGKLFQIPLQITYIKIMIYRISIKRRLKTV